MEVTAKGSGRGKGGGEKGGGVVNEGAAQGSDGAPVGEDESPGTHGGESRVIAHPSQGEASHTQLGEVARAADGVGEDGSLGLVKGDGGAVGQADVAQDTGGAADKGSCGDKGSSSVAVEAAQGEAADATHDEGAVAAHDASISSCLALVEVDGAVVGDVAHKAEGITLEGPVGDGGAPLVGVGSRKKHGAQADCVERSGATHVATVVGDVIVEEDHPTVVDDVTADASDGGVGVGCIPCDDTGTHCGSPGVAVVAGQCEDGGVGSRRSGNREGDAPGRSGDVA